MSYFKSVVVFVLWITYLLFATWFHGKSCHAQYYEDDYYSDNAYGNYYSDYTIIADEYDGYQGYSSYDARSGIIDHYDVYRGYTGFSEINRRTGMVDHYDVELGYTGYSQIYLGR